MKNVPAIMVVSFLVLGIAMANPPLDDKKQYEQYCESAKVSGTGDVFVDTSITDKWIALEYTNYLNGSGQFAMDSTHVYSNDAAHLERPTFSSDGETKTLNFYEDTKLEYDNGGNLANTLEGEKFINSKGFYGGMNANVKEAFEVNRIEKTQNAFFGSTKNSNVSHTIGLDTANDFNGSWGTTSRMKKIFYKDINDTERFTGEFQVQKEIKFHENATEEEFVNPCAGVDC